MKYVWTNQVSSLLLHLRLVLAGKPHNPMLNAGAIMSCALILQVTLSPCSHPTRAQMIEPPCSLAEKYDFMLNYLQVFLQVVTVSKCSS